MSFEINLNDDNGSSIDGFLQWSARGTQDGSVAPCNFYVSDDGEKVTFETIKKDGVILDIYNMKTGWNKWEGTTTQWEWNENLVDWKAKPGDDWKQGLQIEVSSGEKVYIWRQAGTAVMQGFGKLAKLINGNATGKLPKVKLKSAEQMKFKSGTSTAIPILEILSWEDRPFQLEARTSISKSGDDAEF